MRGRTTMKKIDLEAMLVDDLWTLHERVSKILSVRIASEKRELEKRLAYLNSGKVAVGQETDLAARSVDGEPRRKYPSETWSGRGKQPRWLVAAIKSGRKIDDFRIGVASKTRQRA
jgi:DNA-binding protein H-NS